MSTIYIIYYINLLETKKYPESPLAIVGMFYAAGRMLTIYKIRLTIIG